MKPLFVKRLDAQSITKFIYTARDQYYAEHGDSCELLKNMGKAIAYAEAAWMIDTITEYEANELIDEAKAVIEEVAC